MRIAYLHGLESLAKGPKNDYLKTLGDVYDPQINYRDPNVFKKLLRELKEFKPDVIIGSSMGGYFAMVLADYLNIPGLLFNPAVHSRSIDIELPFKKYKKSNTKYLIVLGKSDTIIEPSKTINIFRENRLDYRGVYFNGGHRIPEDLFFDYTRIFLKIFK